MTWVSDQKGFFNNAAKLPAHMGLRDVHVIMYAEWAVAPVCPELICAAFLKNNAAAVIQIEHNPENDK